MSELTEILSATVARLLGDHVTRPVLEAAEEGEWPAALWAALEENGLTQPLIPADAGGVGAGWADAFVIARAAGRSGAPVPLPETMVAGWLLAESGLEVPAGPLGLAPMAGGTGLRLDAAGNGWSLSGSADGVPWGAAAGHVVVVVPEGEGARIAVVARGAYGVEAGENAAREPRDHLRFDRAAVVDCARLGERLDGGAVRIYGALMRSAQMAGGIAFVLDEAVRYAGDRVQFGRPIGKFQAIQQQLATLAAHAAQAGLAAEAACRAADRSDPAVEVAAAKVVAGEAAGIAVAIGHQVHGAIGYTYEHALHFITRRLWSWRSEFGTEAEWAEEIGRAALARGAGALWDDVTGRQWRKTDST